MVGPLYLELRGICGTNISRKEEQLKKKKTSFNTINLAPVRRQTFFIKVPIPIPWISNGPSLTYLLKIII